MEGSQMLYASWLAQVYFFFPLNIMLVRILHARDALYRTAQATAWKRVGYIFIKLLGANIYFIFKQFLCT